MSTYYVAQSGGSDAGAGSSASPWRTISHAIGAASASDTIIVRAGTYTERLIINKASLTIQADTGATVWVQGNWTPPAGISVTQSDVPLFANDGIDNQGEELVRMSAANVTIDGINLRNWSGEMINQTAASPTVKNCTITGSFGAGIIQIGADDAVTQDVVISRVSLQGIFQLTGAYYYRDGHDYSGAPLAGLRITGHPHVVGPRSANATWTRVTIMDCYGEGFSNYTGLGSTWDDCTIVDNNSPALYINWSPGLTVKNSRIYFTGNFARLATGNGGEAATFGDEAEVDRVTSASAKPHYDQTKNVQIYNNLIVGFASGFLFSGDESNRPANAENILISNNTIIARGAVGDTALRVNKLDGSTPVRYTRVWSNIRIENNIFIGRTVEANNLLAANKAAFLIRNNYFSVAPPAWMTTGVNVDNIVGGAHGLAGTAAPTLLDYGALTQAAHDDFAASDYALTAGSALIDAGIANEVNTTDYNGDLRDTIDLGAIEYSGGASTVGIVADFTVSSADVIEGDAISLTDASTIDTGAIDAWDWDYKLTSAASWTDHSTSSTPGDLTINTAGDYQIRLIVTDTDSGESSQKILSVIVRAAGSDDPGTCTGNVLTNADFAGGTTGWSYNSGGGAGSFAAGSGYAEITITTPAGNLQFYQAGFAITAGVEYRLAFKAKASSARTITAYLFDHVTIDNLGIAGQGFSLTTEWAAQEYIFTAIASSSNARLQIRPLWPAGTVYLDDFCLSAYTAPAAPEAIIDVPSDPATVGVEQTLDGTDSTGTPTAWSWEIDGVEVGTSSTYAWTPDSPRTYTIALTVTNAYGSDTTTIQVAANVAAAGSGAVAALLTGAVPGSTGSDGGTSHTDLGTNTAGLLMLVSGATTAGTAFAGAEIGIGASDGTNGRAVAATSDDNQASVSSGQEGAAATAYLISPVHTMIVDGDAALTDSSTVTMTWNTISAGKLYAALRIAATNAAVGDFVPGGAAVNVGFQPDIVFCWMGSNTNAFAGTGGSSGNISFGFVTADGTRGLLWRSTTGSAAGNVYALHSSTYVCGYLQSTLTDGVTVTLGATGFTHASTGSMTGKVAYLAIKLDGLSTQILDFDTATATGTQSHSANFAAGAAVMLASLAQAVGTIEGDTDASVWSVGFWDGTNERSAAISDEDAADPTVAKSHAQNALLYVPQYDGTGLIAATVDSVTASTFVLDYSAVDSGTARKASVLLIEQAAGATIYDPLTPGLRTGLRTGMN